MKHYFEFVFMFKNYAKTLCLNGDFPYVYGFWQLIIVV